MKKNSRRRPRKRICPPPPKTSARTYIRIDTADIGVFRFLLEGYDNLGIFTVVNKFKGILVLRYSPHLKREVQVFLKAVATEMKMEVIPTPLGRCFEQRA
ncbi:DUF4911 domain-containing protein [Pseudodesulfovibrio sp. JC047]|uniref:DUF4911 domain-containing protein n=1 Tax=Pseudodesulfovibrio sp. JC047 TaxID=2683199 RepID=UPI0013D43B77|nr:DUF4911 domain-containing protein [Pseudodesulfovibrio sp. JC047]NDV18789.1 DUF4911 domain-containing protein [Pseudodesulfovibrio sp. JC047]